LCPNFFHRDLGDDGFVAAEGEALKAVHKKKTIISLTGSNPLATDAMEAFLRHNPGVVIYMDVKETDIIARLRAMKVDRIVGQSTRSMEDILRWRRGFYERFYDLRAVVPVDLSQEAVGNLILEQYLSYIKSARSTSPHYISTRSAQVSQTLSHVALQGLSPGTIKASVDPILPLIEIIAE
jgi:shikimate kinase